MPLLPGVRVTMEHRASHLADAAVCHKIRARHIRTLVRAEKDSRICDFYGFCETTDGNHAEIYVHHRLAIPHSCRLRVEHWSVSHAGTERVHPDATILELRSPSTGVRTQGSFGRRVCSMSRNSHEMHCRADKNDRSCAGHHWQQLLHQENGSLGIEIEYFVEVRGRETVDRTLFRQTGIGYDNVDDTLFGPDRRRDAIDVIELGKISCDSRDVPADHGYGLIQFRLPARGDKDIRAFFDEPLCRSQTNSAITSCHNVYLSFKCAHNLLLFAMTASNRLDFVTIAR